MIQDKDYSHLRKSIEAPSNSPSWGSQAVFFSSTLEGLSLSNKSKEQSSNGDKADEAHGLELCKMDR